MAERGRGSELVMAAGPEGGEDENVPLLEMIARGEALWFGIGLTATPRAADVRLQCLKWMTEVSDELKLGDDTLYAALFHFDAVYTSSDVSLGEIQLLAVSCLYAVSPAESVTPELCSILTDRAFDADQVGRVAREVRSSPLWRPHVVTPEMVIALLLARLPPDGTDRIFSLALVVSDLAHGDISMVRVSAGVLAIGCCVCGLEAVDVEPVEWLNAVRDIVDVDVDQLVSALVRLRSSIRDVFPDGLIAGLAGDDNDENDTNGNTE